jgi:hypothetical protein
MSKLPLYLWIQADQTMNREMKINGDMPGKLIKSFLSSAFLILISSIAQATDVQGYLNTGVWYLKNDLASNPAYISADNYGQSYVQGDFALFNANLTLDALHMNDPGSDVDIGIHLKGRALYNLLDHDYTLAPNDKYRYQLDETNVQFAFRNADLWVGRHTVYEAGGIGVDGATALFHKSDRFGFGIYAGLGNDPRTLTGYIGPTYKTVPFNSDFYAGGLFTRIHAEKFQMDIGANTLVFNRKVDRSNFFTQFFWNAKPSWSYFGMLDIGFMGDKGLQKGMLGVNTKITPKLTNRFSFSEFRSIFYSQSDASGIPVPTGLNPTFVVGTNVNTSEYYTGRDEIQIRFDQNYVFTGLEFARRTFDHQNRAKYLLGYFDPSIFGSEYDFRIETDIIDNYVSFNSSIDMMVGRDFANNKFRAEVGETLYANERDLYEGGVFVNSKGQVEKETTARANLQYSPTHTLAFFLNYAYYKEIDVYNLNQAVHTHEVYLSSNIRF